MDQVILSFSSKYREILSKLLNSLQSLLGYDSVVGDPFAKDGDPGYKAKIFNAVSADKVGRMSMDAG